MASDPQADRIRLVIEPGDDDPRVLGRDSDEPTYQRPDDMIDLGRLDDDPDYEFEDEDAPPARRRILPLGLAAIALAGFGAISWYAYQGAIGNLSDEAIPLIQADAGPIKTRPAAPGGIDVPHQDKLVLNDIAPDPNKPQVERLLPPPEVPRPPAAAREQFADSAVDSAAGPALADPAQDQRASVAGEATGEADGDLKLAPAGKPQEGDAPKSAVADKAVTVKTPSDPAPASKAPTTKALAAPVPPKAEPAPKAPAISAPTTQTAAIPGGFLVQLASLKDKKLVGGEWVRLQKAFPKLLAGKKLVLQEADLGGRGVYQRIRAGYFADQKSAAAFCQALKAKNQACIVVKL